MLTDSPVGLDLTPVVPPAPALPSVMQVPEPHSLAHARKMAKLLFGPLARIWVRYQLGDCREITGHTYEVGTERDGRKKVYGLDDNLQKALQTAVVQVAALEQSRGALPRDIISMVRPSKPVLTRRQKWLLDYVDVYGKHSVSGEPSGPPAEDREEIKALISHLRPNDVKDFQPPTISNPEQTQEYIKALRQAVTRA